MLGAIIGDVINSINEVIEIQYFKNSVDKIRPYQERVKALNSNTPLFCCECSPTDDSVLTTAIADALLHDKNYELYLRKYGNREQSLGLDKYGRNRFGPGFIKWLDNTKQGNSIGNGGAMRISPIGFYFDSLEEIEEEATYATIPSHNTKEAITGAVAVAQTIYLARNKYSKEYIKNYVEKKFNYDLNFNLEFLQKNYKFSSLTSKTVPQAIYCFLISNSFDNAIRIGTSIGGDADTIGAIIGSIAEAYYGIDENLKNEVYKFIPNYMKEVIDKFYKKLDNKNVIKLTKKI